MEAVLRYNMADTPLPMDQRRLIAALTNAADCRTTPDYDETYINGLIAIGLISYNEGGFYELTALGRIILEALT